MVAGVGFYADRVACGDRDSGGAASAGPGVGEREGATHFLHEQFEPNGEGTRQLSRRLQPVLPGGSDLGL